MDTYKIVRFHRTAGIGDKVLKTGLTFREAQAHCNDRETQSKTCIEDEAVAYTLRFGHWFDGFRKEEE